jgi:anti-sigma factor ChrR (cupin superfamily)
MRDSIDEKITEQAAMYSLRILSQSEARAFEQALAEGRAGFAEEMTAFDEVVAELAMSAEERTPSASLRQQLLERISEDKDPVDCGATELRSSGGLQLFQSVGLDEGDWEKAADGVFVKTLFVDRFKRTVTSLIKLEPGSRLPQHRHLGIEESIIIEGDCRVNGEVFRPGDYRRAMAGTTDSEVTTEHGTIFMMVSPGEIDILEPEWNS